MLPESVACCFDPRDPSSRSNPNTHKSQPACQSRTNKSMRTISQQRASNMPTLFPAPWSCQGPSSSGEVNRKHIEQQTFRFSMSMKANFSLNSCAEAGWATEPPALRAFGRIPCRVRPAPGQARSGAERSFSMVICHDACCFFDPFCISRVYDTPACPGHSANRFVVGCQHPCVSSIQGF